MQLVSVAALLPAVLPPASFGLSCPGLRGYALKQCLREQREAEGLGDARDEYLEKRQYEQPGTLVTLPSGVQFRELLEGTGDAAEVTRWTKGREGRRVCRDDEVDRRARGER